MRQVGVAERRARLGRRHRLAGSARAGSVPEVAAALVALHGTDPASVYLAARARLEASSPADVDKALYDDRVLVRMLGMRRTMFAVPLELAPVLQAACTRAIAVQQRRLLVSHLARAGVAADPVRWLDEVAESTVLALHARGEATAAELVTDEPRLRTQLVFPDPKPYEQPQNVTSRVLFLLAADARIVRGRPRGSWTSSQYRWWPMDAWLPGGLAELPVEQAQAELARRWLGAFGPATVADLRWWTGWTAGATRKALAAVRPVEVDLGGATGLVLADDVEPVPPAEPWVALLPGLDPTAMGWVERDWYLGAHAPAVIDRTGNIGPTVWSDGRIVGGWAQRPGGELAYRLLEDVGTDTVAAIESELDLLADWLGPVRVTPRFPAPLDRQLSA